MIEDLKGAETWRVFRIMSEFVEGFEEISDIGPAVTIFGSARFHRNHTYYKKAVEMIKKSMEKNKTKVSGTKEICNNLAF